MTTAVLLQTYGGILTSLVTDLVAILILGGFLYFRRHFRADLLLAYVALNVGIFVTMALLTQVKVDIAVGFGLFAILSIIRLSSSRVTQQEVAYYFLSLVLGLVNGLGIPDRLLSIGMNVVLLVIMWAFDRGRLREQAEQMDVKLDGVYTNGPALRTQLEHQLGRPVGYYEITEVDLIRGHMIIDVRLRPGEGVVVPPHEKKAKEHTEDSAPETVVFPEAVGAAPSPDPRPDGSGFGGPRHGA